MNTDKNLVRRHCALALKELLEAIEQPEKVRGQNLLSSNQVRFANTALKEVRNSNLSEFRGV